MIELILLILALTTFIYLTRDRTMFKQGYIYKVSFIDTKNQDHNVENLIARGSFCKTLEGLQEKGDIKCLAVLEREAIAPEKKPYKGLLKYLLE